MWSRQIDDYNQKCAQTLSIIKNWNCVILLGKFIFNLFSLATMLVNVITPRNSSRLYLRDAREHYQLNKNVGKWWMNGRNDAYSSRITTSTMLNPRHERTPPDYKALDHQLLTV